MEVVATVINVNKGCNSRLMEACEALRGYAEVVARIRAIRGIMKTDDDADPERALDDAIRGCIRDGILADFLSAHRAEVVNMYLLEYDEERHIRSERRDAMEEGLERGREEGREEIVQCLMELGMDEGMLERALAMAQEAKGEPVSGE